MPKSSLSDVSFANVTALGFTGPGAGLTNIPQSAVTGLATTLAAVGSASFPDQTGNAGKVLTTDGTNVAWATVSGGAFVDAPSDGTFYVRKDGSWVSFSPGDTFPTQASNGGKFLTTDGTNVSWATLPASGIADAPSDGTSYVRKDGTWVTFSTGSASFPDQTGNSGKFLTTNGTDVAWATVAAGATTNLNSFSPDAKPLSPSIYDDEFTGNALDGKWTVVNAGSASVLASNTSIPDNLHIRVNNTGSTLVCLLQTLPAGDFTAYTKVAISHEFGTAPNRASGLVISTTNVAGTGSQVLFETSNYSGNQEYVQVYSWSNFSTVGSLIGTTSLADVKYLGFRRVGSTWYAGVSPDGLVWTWATFAPGITPAYIGLTCRSSQASLVDCAFEFFRYIPSATGQLGGPIQATVASPTVPGVVKPGTGLTVAADGTLNVQANVQPTVVAGQLLGTTWTAENTGNLVVAQDGTYGVKFGYTGNDGSDNLRGGYIPYVPTTRRIVWDTEILTTVNFSLSGLFLRAADGTLFGWTVNLDRVLYTAPATAASTTPAYATTNYTHPDYLVQNALDIDASGNWVWSVWTKNRWRQVASGTLAFTPTGLGYYHRTYGTNTSTRLSGLAFKTYQSDYGPESFQAVLAPPPPSFDVYSTTEFKTNKLFNGRPVYRKLYTTTGTAALTGSTATLAHGLTGIAEWVGIWGKYDRISPKMTLDLPHAVDATNSIALYIDDTNINTLGTAAYAGAGTVSIWVEYTKTVDATITPTPSGWAVTDLYSLSETLTNKVWIDGKPIWRKVVTLGTLSNTGSDVAFNHNILGISEITDFDFLVTLTGSGAKFKLGGGSAGAYYASADTTAIHYATNSAWGTGATALGIIEYTRNASVAFSTTNLLAKVLFSEGSGTVALNSGPSGGSATIPNGSTWLEGGLNQPGNVNGLAFNTPRAVTATTAMTIMGWVKLGTTTGSHEDFAVVGGGTNRRTFIVSRSGSRVMCYWDSSSGGWTQSSVALSTDVWTHVAWVLDPGSNNIYFYKNGVLAETIARTTWAAATTQQVTVGSNVGEYFKGTIHDFYLYDGVVTAGEIASHYATGK